MFKKFSREEDVSNLNILKSSAGRAIRCKFYFLVFLNIPIMLFKTTLLLFFLNFNRFTNLKLKDT